MTVTRRSICLGLPALALAGCGGGAPAPARAPVTASSGAARAPGLRKPRFGDSDPVDFPGRGPAHHPVHGIDLAHFQSTVNWPAARAAGVSFAFIKATEGGDIVDPMFHHHWRGAARAGIPAGAYHFYYFCTPPEVQARWFIRNVPKRAGMLPPVLDMEWNAFSPSCQTRPPGAEVRAQARSFLDIVQAHYGQRPIVYTTPGFHRDTDIGRMNEEFWLRSTAAHPRDSFPGHRWRFWQYTGTGIVPGIAEGVDLNVFSGNARDWAAWRQARRV